jgi:hypothetical protein
MAHSLKEKLDYLNGEGTTRISNARVPQKLKQQKFKRAIAPEIQTGERMTGSRRLEKLFVLMKSIGFVNGW